MYASPLLRSTRFLLGGLMKGGYRTPKPTDPPLRRPIDSNDLACMLVELLDVIGQGTARAAERCLRTSSSVARIDETVAPFDNLVGIQSCGHIANYQALRQVQGAFRSAIHKTLIDSAHGIVLALRTSGLDGMLAEEHRHLPDVILRVKSDDTLNPEIADAIETLWGTPAVVRLLDNNEGEVYLPDSAVYFFTQIQRLAKPEYTPMEDDVLRTPAQKNCITETRFRMGELSIRVIDVGPLRSERKKWIHCFESVTSIIFCTALSDYDQVLVEDRGQNRMRESLYLFESIINSRWFLRTSIILFLTEVDTFEAKIRKVSSSSRSFLHSLQFCGLTPPSIPPSQIPLSTYFPEYAGGPDVNKAAKYILWKFMQENRARLTVYPHLTRTDDTQSVRLVFAAVKETILQNAIKDIKDIKDTILGRVAGAIGLL
ncbi:Heterotrimeric G-protein alpha subunit [Mycena sanguinolenta]|uniref:Heterotrimeric G-protein alpha subunit n=1 Tax=Mycena sanguinolenta TaxID=230812 RepID=A0A8H6Z9Z7_9AGAR|nr:Heterotrimeric G-protein alpha subunit [Mycena sanguinolenta]